MTLLDDFQTFVKDAEAGTQYAKWAHDNPGELERWQTFRDAILAGSRPTVPPMLTPHGRELVDAGIQYLHATAPAPAPAPAPSPTATPTPAPTKTFDGGTGTSIDAFLASLQPGDIAGLTGSCLIAKSVGHAGTPTAPIVVTSANPSTPATLKGRLAMYGSAAWWTFDQLLFDDDQTAQPTSWVVGGHNNIFRRLACTNHRTHIGWNLINDPTYGQSHDNLIEQCRIYEIGADTNHAHGVYNLGTNNTVRDCLIYDCASRGIQDREATNGRYLNNILSDNGMGLIFGDLTGSKGGRASKNILAHRLIAGRYLVESYNNGGGSDNLVDDNFVFDGGVMPGLENVTVTNVHTADPLFRDRAARDYRLGSGSPAAGYGPAVWPPL